MTKTLKCDKPVDLDEARKAKGLPRRKRDDPKATAYELRIRVPAEFQGVMGRKKLSRTVFARNKREELRARVAEFEEDGGGHWGARRFTAESRNAFRRVR